MKSELWLRVIFQSTPLLFIILPIQVESLKCYQCGVEGTPPCHAFEFASTWRPFEVECPLDNICVKTVSSTGKYDELCQCPYEEDYCFIQGGTVRGCGPERVASGDKWPLTCDHAQLSSTLMCMCNKQLCNSAVNALPELASLILLSLVTLFHFVRYVQ